MPVEIDPRALAEFRTNLRRRYSDAQILEALRASAERLGRSPTMKEFDADPEAGIHPQTVIDHFGTWNKAKREAGLMPRRNATRQELLEQLRRLGVELGRTPTTQDIQERRASMPSPSLYWHTFGSLAGALREAGFEVAVGEERLERALEQGAALARRLGRLPKFADWQEARRADTSMLTEWQAYRLVDGWPSLQFLIRERLLGEGATVAPDGTVST